MSFSSQVVNFFSLLSANFMYVRSIEKFRQCKFQPQTVALSANEAICTALTLRPSSAQEEGPQEFSLSRDFHYNNAFPSVKPATPPRTGGEPATPPVTGGEPRVNKTPKSLQNKCTCDVYYPNTRINRPKQLLVYVQPLFYLLNRG